MNTPKQIQESTIELLNSFSSKFQYAVTFTFHSKAFIENKNYKRIEIDDTLTMLRKKMPQYNWGEELKKVGHTAYLSDAVADATMDFFYARLTHRTWGKDAKRPSTRDFCKPLLITTAEGSAKSLVRTHRHGIIGNLPEHIKCIDPITLAWGDTDFGGRIVVKPIKNIDGWLEYITKEIYTGNDATLQVDRIRKPNTFR